MNRHGAAVLAVTVAFAVASCGPAHGNGPSPTLPPGGVKIVAESLAFDTQRLEIHGGTPFGVLFENREGAPHNLRIYDDRAGEPLFVGEVFSGPATRLYEVPALPAGRHLFRCDVHPGMAGELVAT